ncbi:MAG: PEP-CTERM sorting domain-containing protein [Isosphaeraceae bacterium]
MTRRFLTLGLAAAVLALGGMNARAGSLPTTLDTLIGGSATEGNLEFSDFGYTNHGNAPSASQVSVLPYTSPAGDTGISFQASPSFFAPANTTVDYSITYTVTALTGTISDAFLQITGGNFGGTGSADVSETVTWGTHSAGLDTSFPTGSLTSTVTFPPQTTISITKDIFLEGGSNGVTVSVIDQAFSTGAIPEPTSMALLGIGLSGLFTFRRFLKRAFVA